MLFVLSIPSSQYEQQIVYGIIPERAEDEENLDNGQNMGNRPSARVAPSPIKGLPKSKTPLNQIILRNGGLLQEVPLENLVEQVLDKLDIKSAVWCLDKNQHYMKVLFLRDEGPDTENCLHLLREAGVGSKLGSILSIIPCSVFESAHDTGDDNDDEYYTAWKEFVESVRSKLTVAEVVDGVKASAELNFDYILLILTADFIAAVSLIENDAVNVTAAMLISPLMSTVVAMTFGTAIADRSLQKTGFKSNMMGMVISLVFGFIFGILVGTTAHPWGKVNWPTDEMKVRGTLRSLWIGALWALPSGSGVALALLQGMAGPLIGVAISATLLPPIVNCGMLWGLTCMKLRYGDSMKIPHLEGEAFHGNSSYVPVWSSDIATELACLGAISYCLFLVNFACIFAAAMVVLKIKEIAAPYTSTSELQKFWAKDIKDARERNKSIQASRASFARSASRDFIAEGARKSNVPEENLVEALQAAIREAVEDKSFKKIQRCSYAPGFADAISQAIGRTSRRGSMAAFAESSANNRSSMNDPAMMEELIGSLLKQRRQSGTSPHQAFNRMRSPSRSMSGFRNSIRRRSSAINQNQGGNLPTIIEGNNTSRENTSRNTRPLSLTERAINSSLVRNLVQNINPAAIPEASRRRNSEAIALVRQGKD